MRQSVSILDNISVGRVARDTPLVFELFLVGHVEPPEESR